MNKILITGGSGRIGRRLADELVRNGLQPFLLSRVSAVPAPYAGSYVWDPSTGIFDSDSLSGTDAIFHLAGAGIADQPWSPGRKAEILQSRSQSALLLAKKLKETPNKVKTIIAASAVGYYGDTGEKIIAESDPAGSGFLAETCQAWEEALSHLALPGIRLVIFRIGFVIDRKGGALPEMMRPVKLFAGAPYGTGRQYISWIDIDDLTSLFFHSLYNETMNGVYNAVAPSPITNKEFVQSLGAALHRPVWPFNIPGAIFRMILGEQAQLVLQGQRVSAEKVLSSKFVFRFPKLSDSLLHQLRN